MVISSLLFAALSNVVVTMTAEELKRNEHEVSTESMYSDGHEVLLPTVTTSAKVHDHITWATMQHVVISRASDARISICGRDTVDDACTKQEVMGGRRVGYPE